MPEVLSRLKPGGFLLLESGVGQAERVGGIVEKEGLALQEVLNDLQKIPRCLIARNV